MKKEEFLTDEFLEQFKNGEELTNFLKQIQKRGIEKILEGELNAHLGYAKHDKRPLIPAIDMVKRSLKPIWEKPKIKVPRDRESSFEPTLVPKRGNMAKGVENVII